MYEFYALLERQIVLLMSTSKSIGGRSDQVRVSPEGCRSMTLYLGSLLKRHDARMSEISRFTRAMSTCGDETRLLHNDVNDRTSFYISLVAGLSSQDDFLHWLN